MEFIADKLEKDEELLTLIDVLEEIKNEKDVRPFLRDRFCIRQALQDSKMI